MTRGGIGILEHRSIVSASGIGETVGAVLVAALSYVEQNAASGHEMVFTRAAMQRALGGKRSSGNKSAGRDCDRRKGEPPIKGFGVFRCEYVRRAVLRAGFFQIYTIVICMIVSADIRGGNGFPTVGTDALDS